MKFIIYNFIINAVFCLRITKFNSYNHSHTPCPSKAFISHSTKPSITNNANTNIHPLNNSDVDTQPQPYSSGYMPQMALGTFKYCGQKLDSEIKPINNYVLIIKNDFHEISQGGVYIGAKRNQEFIGRVVAVGPGKLNQETGVTIPVSVKVGDMVLFEPPEEDPVLTCDNQKCALITDDKIYAKIVTTDFSTPTALVADRIRPLSDRVFVKIIDTPNKTESGLVLARTGESQDNVIRAVIVSLGPGEYTNDGKLIPINDLQVGDHILFSDSAADGGEFSCNQKQHAFVRYRAILAKL